MKFLTFLFILFPLSSLACKGETTYIDIGKVKKSVEIIADHVTIRHTKSLNFKTKMNIKIEKRKSQVIGGLFLFDVIRKSPEKMTGVIAVTENKKIFKIKITILPQKKGGCSKGIVTYN